MASQQHTITPAQRTEIEATWAAHPDATLVLVTMGHGYGKARHDSTCGLTGDRINAGEAIRHVVVASRSGHTWAGYIANRTLGWLDIRSSGTHTMGFSRFSKCRGQWWQALQGAQVGQVLTLQQRGGCTVHTTTQYTLRQDGKWHGRNYSKLSTAQLQANMRRSKKNMCYTLR